MRIHRPIVSIVSLFAVLASVLPAYAAFSDLSSTSFAGQIQVLADMGIVKGNPDGTFAPVKTVNRAELLIMLYRAANKTPEVPMKACFKDVPAGEWYSAVVCDAAKNKYIGGYPDGNFRPGQEVNRVEALKMIHTVLGLNLDMNASMVPVSAYTDVSLSAWYAPYIASAFMHHILPAGNEQKNIFNPSVALTRSEAAVYIFNALELDIPSSSSSAASVMDESSSSQAASSVVTSANYGQTTEVDFPFGDDGTFTEKLSKTYRFTLKQSNVIKMDVTVDSDKGAVTCRLYKIDAKSDFSLEYYLGHMVDNTCELHVALSSGEYQLQIKPTIANLNYTVMTVAQAGDGNDGFREAAKLTIGTSKAGNLDAEDVADWYYIDVATQKTMTVQVTNAENVQCLVYPMANVNLFGFDEPLCNTVYEFPTGTYYIGVMKRSEDTKSETFSIMVK